jgi:hypothetical protein
MFVAIVAALAASVVYVVAVFVLPLLVPFLVSRLTGTSGGAGASFGDGPVLAIALVAFAAGFYWRFRRGST